MCGGSEVTCPAGPFVLSGAGSATGGGGGEAPSAPRRTPPLPAGPDAARPEPPGSSSRGTQRRGPAPGCGHRSGHTTRVGAQGGSHLRWQQQKPSSPSDRSTAKENLCKLFSMTL